MHDTILNERRKMDKIISKLFHPPLVIQHRAMMGTDHCYSKHSKLAIKYTIEQNPYASFQTTMQVVSDMNGDLHGVFCEDDLAGSSYETLKEDGYYFFEDFLAELIIDVPYLDTHIVYNDHSLFNIELKGSNCAGYLNTSLSKQNQAFLLTHFLFSSFEKDILLSLETCANKALLIKPLPKVRRDIDIVNEARTFCTEHHISTIICDKDMSAMVCVLFSKSDVNIVIYGFDQRQKEQEFLNTYRNMKQRVSVISDYSFKSNSKSIVSTARFF